MFIGVNKRVVAQSFLNSKEFALARRNADRILRSMALIKRLKETHIKTNHPTWEIVDLFSNSAVKRFFFLDKEAKKDNPDSGPTQILICELYPLRNDYVDMKNDLEIVTQADLTTAIRRLEHMKTENVKPLPSIFEVDPVIRKLYDIKIDLEKAQERFDQYITNNYSVFS